MLTRRSFLGTVAALVVAPVAAKAAPVATERIVSSRLRVYEGQVFISTTTPAGRIGWVAREFCRVPRRDDGDTILELR